MHPRAYRAPLAVLTSLFFLWGFITVLNDVLVPHWKDLFQLTYAQSLLVQFCFFGAYFVGSVIYYLISISSGDPIDRIGYKRGLLLGLGISALGCALFAPASLLHNYSAHLAALFVLGLGFTVLQIAANPFVAIIGPPEGASSRLNLAQAFNSLGTTLAPLIGGWLIFDQADASSAVRAPYLGLALLLVVIAVVVQATRLPEPPRAERMTHSNALRHPQLRWGMVAIFCYVGAEVAVGSLIISFLALDGVMGFREDVAKHYLSLYWGGAMAGRFIGSVALNKTMPPGRKLGVMAAIGAAMFVLLMVLNATGPVSIGDLWPMALLIAANIIVASMATMMFVLLMVLNATGPVSIGDLWPMALLIAANIIVAMLAKGNPGRAMGLFALVAVALLGVVITGQGSIALWSIVAVGLFNSILWSNIFTLSIDGLGHDTAQGSSLLVMMILGGAIIPWVQASVIDALGHGGGGERAFHLSFLLPLACYAYLVWYGLRGSTLRSRP